MNVARNSANEVELPNAYGKSPEFRDIFMRVADMV